MSIIDRWGIWLLAAAGALISIVWSASRSSAILQQWASDNGYSIIKRQYALFFRGPFFWTSNKNQTVYRVTVQDSRGAVRSGWVRCGNWWWGLSSNETEVRWDG